ncbi:hypothetical protein ACTXT7_004203 [Hymenolepis weldensis]
MKTPPKDELTSVTVTKQRWVRGKKDKNEGKYAENLTEFPSLKELERQFEKKEQLILYTKSKARITIAASTQLEPALNFVNLHRFRCADPREEFLEGKLENEKRNDTKDEHKAKNTTFNCEKLVLYSAGDKDQRQVLT